MTTNELLTMAAFMLAPAFFSLLGMGAFGSPIIAVLGELSAKAKSRVFYDKFGQQTASMGLVLLLMMLVIYGAAFGIVLFKFPQFIQNFSEPTPPIINACFALGVFIILGIPYYLSWQKMRKAKGIHIALGLGSAIASVTGIAIAVPAKLMIGLSTDISRTAIPTPDMAWPLATMYSILIISAAAALSCVYLVTRRKKDDFGRDYYNFSLRLAARWAAIPMIGFLACQGWLLATLPDKIRVMTLDTSLGIVWAAAAGLGVLCVVIWLVIARSTTPLQFKGLTFLAIGLFWLMHTLNATLFINFMSMF